MQEQTVDGFVAGLGEAQGGVVARVREVVGGADGRVREGIKWNAPSFAVAGAADGGADARRWFATMNVRPGAAVRLVLHAGAKAEPGQPRLVVDDPEGLLRWLGEDRAIVSFADQSDVEAKREALTRILQQWVEQLAAR